MWRVNHPLLKQFTWIKPNGSSRSRVNLWLASPEILNFVTNVSVSAAPLTDHCVITPKPDINHRLKKNYWKFNADLLNVDEYLKAVKALQWKLLMMQKLTHFIGSGNILNISSEACPFNLAKPKVIDKRTIKSNYSRVL